MMSGGLNQYHQGIVSSQSQMNCICANTLEKLEKQLDILNNTILVVTQKLSKQIEDVDAKLDDLKTEISTIQSYVTKDVNDHNFFDKLENTTEATIRCKFPVATSEDLLLLNAEINLENRETYIAAIASLLQPDGVIRNLKCILSNDVVMGYNVDGVHGKAALKSLQNFYTVLLDSILLIGGMGPAEDQLRKGIQLQKKRAFKAQSTMKKHNDKKIKLEIEACGAVS